jgi:hypothetical protein
MGYFKVVFAAFGVVLFSTQAFAYSRCELTLRSWKSDVDSYWSVLSCDGQEISSQLYSSESKFELLTEEGRKVSLQFSMGLDFCEFRDLMNVRDFVCTYSNSAHVTEENCVLVTRQWKDGGEVFGTLYCNGNKVFSELRDVDHSAARDYFVNNTKALGYEKRNCQMVELLNVRDYYCFFSK